MLQHFTLFANKENSKLQKILYKYLNNLVHNLLGNKSRGKLSLNIKQSHTNHQSINTTNEMSTINMN